MLPRISVSVAEFGRLLHKQSGPSPAPDLLFRRYACASVASSPPREAGPPTGMVAVPACVRSLYVIIATAAPRTA